MLLEAAYRCGVKRFIHVSTDEVYGENEGEHYKEEMVLEPTNPYSATKAAAEFIAKSYLRSFKLPLIITRGTFKLPFSFLSSEIFFLLIFHFSSLFLSLLQGTTCMGLISIRRNSFPNSFAVSIATCHCAFTGPVRTRAVSSLWRTLLKRSIRFCTKEQQERSTTLVPTPSSFL